MEIRDFRDLRVWHAGIELVKYVYSVTEAFPSKEVYGLTNQMRRAAVSIPSNIAEGHEREHLKEYLHHVSIAQGSLAGLETQSVISQELGFISEEQLEDISEKIASLRRQLYSLRNSLTKDT